jgi:hypothetical protein
MQSIHQLNAHLESLLSIRPQQHTIKWIWNPSFPDNTVKGGFESKVRVTEVNNFEEVICLSSSRHVSPGFVNGLAKALPKEPKMLVFSWIAAPRESCPYEAIRIAKDLTFSDPLHVVVLAQFEPDAYALTTDRWDVTRME